jgi:exopolysaccharide production protein ExoZ
MGKAGRLDWVQALRGIAALAVVICHARNYLLTQPYGIALEIALRPGAMGVDLFFLVSGFIMVYTTEGSSGSVLYTADFLAKRLARVWPVYAVMVVLFMGYGYAWHMGALPWGHIGRSLAFLPIDARKPPYFDLPYGLGWTLNFEVYFYVVLGLSMLAGRFRWPAFYGWMGLMLLVLPFAASGNVSMQANHDYNIGIDWVDQAVNPVIWDFVAGTAIGLLSRSSLKISSRRLAWSLLVITVVISVWFSETGRTTFHGLWNWGGPLAAMFTVMALTFKDRQPVVPRALVWLGGVSFSLYLVHLIVFSELSQLATRSGHADWAGSPLFVVSAILLSLVAAEVSRQFLENGISVLVRKGLLRLLRGTKPAQEGVSSSAA